METAVDIAQLVTAAGAILVPFVVAGLVYFRRPSVSILEDKDRVYSHLEGSSSNYPHVRLLAANKGWRRAAHGAQVIVVGYRRQGQKPNEMITLGTPALGWPSASAQGAKLTLFPGVARPFDFGSLYPALRKGDGKLESSGTLGPGIALPQVRQISQGGAEWQFRLGIELVIADYREFIPPGAWIVRLVVGADDGSAATYDVHLKWRGDVADPREALTYLLDHLEVSRV